MRSVLRSFWPQLFPCFMEAWRSLWAGGKRRHPAGCCGSAAYRSPGTAYSPYAGLYPSRRRLFRSGFSHAGSNPESSCGFRTAGINAGASFALALCLAFLPGLGFTGVVIFSFLGASVSMLAVYELMSMRHRKLEPVRLVLAGSAVSIFLS